MADANKVLDVVIIGAGISGLTMAIMLQKNLGYYNYTIYEMASDLGGTWHLNEYPSCTCDLPAHCLLVDPNPDWSCLFAGHQEIQKYWKRLVQKHNIEPHIKYNTEFISAVWSEKQQNYSIKLWDSKTKEFKEVKVKLVISVIGVFKHPHWPDVPGRESFQGKLLHTQRWDHGMELSRKRVGLIGNRCVGSQILPVISEDRSTTMVNFCRTPSWYIPRPQMRVSPVVQWVFRNVPFVLKSLRYTVAAGCELLYNQFKDNFICNFSQRLVEKAMLSCMRSLTPPKYHEHLTPNYSFSCKCIIFDPGYLQALGQPNVDMEWDPIAKITPNGIITKSGKEHELDVIAFATGFDVAGSMTPDVTGCNGIHLQEYYDKEGGLTGYMGTTIPGFPNWVTILGPNTVTGTQLIELNPGRILWSGDPTDDWQSIQWMTLPITHSGPIHGLSQPTS
ncbi:hypothetical protein FRC11_014822 [Ceratobasidium sp. 423]|nr:hypothetical protein FRC11_014822 [Ceratobasidium sp. 423]